MNIAVFHELPIGGARIAVNDIARLLKKNHQVDLYIVDDNENTLENSYYNHTFFYRFTPKIWKGHAWNIRLYKDTIELIKLYFLHKKIAQEIDKKKYDVIFVNASQYIESPFLLRFLKTYSIFYCHDPHYRLVYESILDISKNVGTIRYVYEKLNRYFRKLVDKSNFSKANYIIANSKYSKNTILKSYGRESIVCYLGVDTDYFKPSDKKAIDILYIGSHHILDGYTLLEESIRNMEYVPKLYTIFKDKKWIENRNFIRDVYKKSRVVICFGYNEPFGLIAIEAMATGIPVVAVDEAGYKETVMNNKTGFLVSRDPKKIAKKLDYLLFNPEKALLLGKEGRRVANNFWKWENRIDKLIKIFEKCIQK